MTRLAVVGDVHVGCFAQYGGETVAGINERCRATLASLAGAVERANGLDLELVVAGDLFHTRRPEPAVIAAVQRVLAQAKRRPTLVLGNHDSIGPGDHALAPLVPVASVVADKPILSYGVALPDRPGARIDATPGVLHVPWAPGPALPAIAKALAAAPPFLDVVVAHCGIVDGTFPEFLRGEGACDAAALGAILARHRVRAFVAGDYHRHREWTVEGVRLVQIGTLNPTGFSDEGLDGYGSLLVVDTGAEELVRREEIPGPRFVIARAGYVVDDLECAHDRGCTVHVRLDGAPSDEDGEKVAAMLRAHGAADVVVEPAVPDAPAPAAASPTPDDWGEAVADVVAAMALPDGVTSADVVEAARRYLP